LGNSFEKILKKKKSLRKFSKVSLTGILYSTLSSQMTFENFYQLQDDENAIAWRRLFETSEHFQRWVRKWGSGV